MPPPRAPPGETPPDDEPSATVVHDAPADEEGRGIMRSTLRPDWAHPFWGIPVGLLLVIGDALLIPGDQGLTIGGKLVFCVAVAMVLAVTLWAWRVPVKGGLLVGAAVVVGIIAAAVSGDWFGGATEPPAWRDAIVPSVDVAFVIVAAVTWYAGRRKRGELLLVGAVTAAGMVFYGQQEAPVWASIAGVAVTLLFLVPSVGGFSRLTGLAIHALALLGLIQQNEAWFSWTPFPFLSLIPVYLLATWFRDTGRPRRAVWWIGAVVGGGTLLLGVSTLIGGIRKDLPLGESWIMLGIGAGVLGAFMGLWFWRRQAATPAAAAT